MHNLLPLQLTRIADFRAAPSLERIPSIRQAKSVLEFAAAAEDNGATFACATFSPKTMERPMQSAFAVTLNVTCEYRPSRTFVGLARILMFHCYLNSARGQCEFGRTG